MVVLTQYYYSVLDIMMHEVDPEGSADCHSPLAPQYDLDKYMQYVLGAVWGVASLVAP